MHLYVLSRGIKNEVDNAINDLQAQYFPMTLNGQPNQAQLAIRPVQLWEFVFPKDAMPCMIKTLCGMAPGGNYNSSYIGKGSYFAMIRRALGAQKLPLMDLTNTPKRLIRNKWINWNIIGTREDVIDVNGNERL